MQGAGVLAMMLSLLIPNYGNNTSMHLGKSEVQLTPTQLSSDDYGMRAIGRF